MKLPNDVLDILTRKFQGKHREWLKGAIASSGDGGAWPLEINLDIPTEQEALRRQDDVRAWSSTWRMWQGSGSLVWSERRWRLLGTQRLPERLILAGPADVTQWVGEAIRWSRAIERFKTLTERWPILADVLPKHFNVFADYDDLDFLRLTKVVSWICSNPNSGLYPRQIPVAGIDSKWLESRKRLVSELVTTIQGNTIGSRDFFECCGLKSQPQLIRMRMLAPDLRNHFCGLGDVSAPLEEIASVDINPTHVFIVENLQTGLAFEDLAGTVVIMGLGYGVDVLGKIPWLQHVRCIYWGDIDTHGLAILNRARTYLPRLEAVLMDESTLLAHRELWSEEKIQNSAKDLLSLTDVERSLFHSLRSNTWGQQIRLEQERIRWDVAWNSVRVIYDNNGANY